MPGVPTDHFLTSCAPLPRTQHIKWKLPWAAQAEDVRHQQHSHHSQPGPEDPHLRRANSKKGVERVHAVRSRTASIVPSAHTQAQERSALGGGIASSQRMAASVRQLSGSMASARQRFGKQAQLDEARKTYESPIPAPSSSKPTASDASARKSELQSARSSY